MNKLAWSSIHGRAFSSAAFRSSVRHSLIAAPVLYSQSSRDALAPRATHSRLRAHPRHRADRSLERGMEKRRRTILLLASPQAADLNHGPWQHLENYSAAASNRYRSVWVIAGPIFDPATPKLTIGDLASCASRSPTLSAR